jgi:uncharacterized glyoxalase superfamily metalloenzyme YdcJ
MYNELADKRSKQDYFSLFTSSPLEIMQKKLKSYKYFSKTTTQRKNLLEETQETSQFISK